MADPRIMRDKVLSGLPGTRKQIELKSGASSSTVGKWLAILRAEKAIYIACWYRSNGGSKRPVFVVGAGKDAKEPKTLTDQDHQQRYNAKHPGRRKEIRARAYRRFVAVRDYSKRTGWFAALQGLS